MPTDGDRDPPRDGGDGPTENDAGAPAADGGGEEPTDDSGAPTDEAVVQSAAEAAEGLVFSRYKQSEVRDLDVTVTFEGGVLDVDVYLNAPDEPDPEQVADDAALAAQAAVDDLFDGA